MNPALNITELKSRIDSLMPDGGGVFHFNITFVTRHGETVRVEYRADESKHPDQPYSPPLLKTELKARFDRILTEDALVTVFSMTFRNSRVETACIEYKGELPPPPQTVSPQYPQISVVRTEKQERPNTWRHFLACGHVVESHHVSPKNQPCEYCPRVLIMAELTPA
jgi:hypothetical protein